MALSGSFANTICSGHYGIRVDWTATQSVANNTSTITAKVYMYGDWALGIGTRTCTVSINGVSSSFTAPAISQGNTNWSVLLGSVSQTVAHNSDGTKSVALAATANFEATISGTYYASISASTTATLNTIARASTPTLSASSVAFGSAITIYTNRASSSFTHHLYYSINGGSEVAITSGIGASYSWTVPSSLMNNIPNATSATITFRLYTFNGSTNIGSKTISFKATVPSSVVPTINSITCTDPTGYLSTYGGYVQNKSKVNVVVSGSGTYSSSIIACKVVANGVTYATHNITTGVLKSSGTNTITVTITDSRGRTATKTTSISVLAYSNPRITALSAYRCLSDGTADESGAYMKVTVAASITSLNSKNAKTFTLKYKVQSATSYTTSSTWSSAYSVATSVVIAADVNSSYDIQLIATDAFTSIPANTSIGTAFTLMDFNATGRGIGIGKVSEQDAFECDLPAIFSSCKTTSGANLDSLLQNTAGKFVLPNGLKICWGRADTVATSYATLRNASVFFPVVFSANPVVIAGKTNSYNSSVEMRITVGSGATTTTNTVLWASDPNGEISNLSVSIRWIAIGY